MKVRNRTERRSRRHLRSENERLASQVVNLQEYVAALEHARIHDHLCTDLLNRIGFAEAAEGFNERIQDGDSADYWVGVVDLDEFKAVNDTFGHAVGDTAIQSAAAFLDAAVDGHGLLARLGGDEFAFLVDGAGFDVFTAANYAGTLAITIEPGVTLRGEPAGPVTITLSIGVAAYNPWVSLGALKHAADQAMYEAKQVKGTGSLVIHSSMDGAPVQERPLHRLRDQRHRGMEAA